MKFRYNGHSHYTSECGRYYVMLAPGEGPKGGRFRRWSWGMLAPCRDGSGYMEHDNEGDEPTRDEAMAACRAYASPQSPTPAAGKE